LIYINDLSNASKRVFLLLFADDSNLFFSVNDPNSLVKSMCHEMTYVVDWLKLNKLSLNLKKTHFIIFRRPRAKIILTEKLIVSNKTIGIVEHTKFLGVMIDQCLSFKKHIAYTKGKISRGVGVLYKCRRTLGNKIMKTLYNTFVYPYFIYCIEVWGNSCKTYYNHIITVHNRAIRLIVGAKKSYKTGTGARKYTSVSPIFKRLKLLDFHEIYVNCVQLLMYKFYHNMLPDIYQEMCVLTSSIHDKFTRQRENLSLPLIKKNPYFRTIRRTGVVMFNYFKTHIELGVSCSVYKYKLKNQILNCTNIWSKFDLFGECNN